MILLAIASAWLCSVAVAGAGAGLVRKCSGRESHSYVSGACPPGTHEVWTRRVELEPAAMDERKRGGPAAMAARKPRRPPATGHGQGTAGRPKETACDAAKRRRAEIRDRDWYTITYQRLSALDERVARACR